MTTAQQSRPTAIDKQPASGRLAPRAKEARRMPLVPVLETDRLTLRGHCWDDFADSLAMWGDAGVTRFIGGKPLAAEDVWSRMLRYGGHWAMLGFGYWVIEEKATGRFVGEAGFHDLLRDIDPPFDHAPEAGWALAPWAHGQGFAGETVAAMMAWGDNHFGRVRTVCLISPDNAPSFRVAERAGYCEYARTTYKGSPTALLERTP
jgi:RimJ/RimL family protein N-acetyltransferase